MKKYREIVKVKEDEVSLIQKILSEPFFKYYEIGNIIKTYSAMFPDNSRLDIKIINGDEGPFAQAELYKDKRVRERLETKRKVLLGEYSILYHDNMYTVSLEQIDKIQAEAIFLPCKVEGCKGIIYLDSDSYETYEEGITDNGLLELSTKVKGYCDTCDTEHIYSIQGYADVKIK